MIADGSTWDIGDDGLGRARNSHELGKHRQVRTEDEPEAEGRTLRYLPRSPTCCSREQAAEGGVCVENVFGTWFLAFA